MGLRAKFNLVMIVAFAIGLGVATFLAREITTDEAKRQVLNEATLLMRAGTAIRSYTQKEISPLLSEQMSVRFLPHSVPSWSAHTVLRAVQKDYPDYSYKEAALNPTNPADRANNWEADIIAVFKRHAERAVPDLRPALPAERPGLPRLPFNACRGAADDGRPLRQRQRLRLDAR